MQKAILSSSLHIARMFITNFSRCCGWLRFAAQPKFFIFTLGIQTFVLPHNNNNNNKGLETYLGRILGQLGISELQKITLLGTAHILRRVLSS